MGVLIEAGADIGMAGRAQPPAQRRIVPQAAHLPGQIGGIAGREMQPGHAFAHRVLQGADAGCDDRHAMGHGFGGDDREGFEPEAGHQQSPCAAIDGSERRRPIGDVYRHPMRL